MKTAIVIFTLLLWLPSFAQKETVFKVSAPKKITLIPDIDTLLSGHDYFFKLKGIEPEEVAEIQFSGGTVSLKDSGLILSISSDIGIIPNSKGGSAPAKKYLLSIYSKNTKLSGAIFQKGFAIIKMAEKPTFQTPGATRSSLLCYWYETPLSKNDTVTKKRLVGRNILSAFINEPYTITSFKMSVTCNGVTENFSSLNEQLSPAMLKKVSELTEGCTIVLKEIKYFGKTTSPDVLIAGPFSIYVKN